MKSKKQNYINIIIKIILTLLVLYAGWKIFPIILMKIAYSAGMFSPHIEKFHVKKHTFMGWGPHPGIF
mgnify:CR=1 FL=1|jgi:hypothetical protein